MPCKNALSFILACYEKSVACFLAAFLLFVSLPFVSGCSSKSGELAEVPAVVDEGSPLPAAKPQQPVSTSAPKEGASTVGTGNNSSNTAPANAGATQSSPPGAAPSNMPSAAATGANYRPPGFVPPDASTSSGSQYGQRGPPPGAIPAGAAMPNSPPTNPAAGPPASQTPVPVPKGPKTLRERAEEAFAKGHEKIAYQLMLASTLATPSELSNSVSSMRWAPSRSVPKLGVRIAVGVDLKAPEGLTDFKPIGSVQQGVGGSSNAANRGGMPQGGPPSGPPGGYGGPGSGTGAPGTNPNGPTLISMTGAMGEVLISRIRSLHEEGKLAPIFKSIAGVKPGAATGAAKGTNGPGFGPGYTGPGNNGYGPGSGPPSGPGANAVSEAPPDVDDPSITSLAPGLGFIGKGTTAELTKRANKQGFDSLVVYEVAVSGSRRSPVIQNECKAKVINLGDGKVIASSKILKNTDVQKEIQKGTEGVVEKGMQGMLDKISEKCTLIEIPTALTAEIVQTRRLGKLIEKASESPMEALLETKLYESLGFLNESQIVVAWDAILGEQDSLALRDGTPEERLAVVTKLLKADR